MLTTYSFKTHCTDEINTILETFQNNSVPNFTQEINIKNMKDPKALETILVNSLTNSNLKPRRLSGNKSGS